MELELLMEQVHRGDKEAFATLYSRYNNVVFRIAYNATRDKDQSIQVVKAVFKDVYETLRARGAVQGDFNAWLDGLTMSHLRFLEKNKPGAQVPVPPSPVFESVPVGVPAAPRKLQKTAASARESTPVNAYRVETAQPRQERPARRYTPEEAQAIEQRARARLERTELEEEEKIYRPSLLLGIAGFALCAELLWLLVGLLMRLEVLPEVDLGFKWFNETFFPLF